jgi:hypothetical protein
MPLNLQPPTVFTTPVKVYIPCPTQMDVTTLSLYLYNGTEWVLACDADGNLHPGAAGCFVRDSRVNHQDTDPPSIEVRLYHFTGIQAAISWQAAPSSQAASSPQVPITVSDGGGGAGG